MANNDPLVPPPPDFYFFDGVLMNGGGGGGVLADPNVVQIPYPQVQDAYMQWLPDLQQVQAVVAHTQAIRAHLTYTQVSSDEATTLFGPGPWFPEDRETEITRIRASVADEKELAPSQGMMQYRYSPDEAHLRYGTAHRAFLDAADRGAADEAVAFDVLQSAFRSITSAKARQWLEGRAAIRAAFSLKWPVLLDSDPKYGELWSLPICMGFRRFLFVRVWNSTPKPDGTREEYFIPVDTELRPLGPQGVFGEPQEYTARNAVASTFGLRGEKYKVRLAA